MKKDQNVPTTKADVSVSVQEVFIEYSVVIKHFASFYGGYRKGQEANNPFLTLWIKVKILTNLESITVVSGLISPRCLFLSACMHSFSEHLSVTASVRSTGTVFRDGCFPGDMSVSLFLWHSGIIWPHIMAQKSFLYILRPQHLVPHIVCASSWSN